MPPELDEAREWLAKSDNDRRSAQVLMDQSPPLTDTAAFHCQQAVEKMLKAYLAFRREPFDRTHDLEELLDSCVRLEAGFDALRTSVRPLTAFAVRFRYPGSPSPRIEAVRGALEVVQHVAVFVATVIQ